MESNKSFLYKRNGKRKKEIHEMERKNKIKKKRETKERETLRQRKKKLNL
jgi:hypothetical protein